MLNSLQDNGNHIRRQKKCSVKESLESLLKIMKKKGISILDASTKIMIIPGYEFRMISGMITNFHQPRSTLAAAYICMGWKMTGRRFTDFALENDSGS